MRAGLLWAIERGVLDKTCAPALNRVRSILGLTPVTHILGKWVHSPDGVLGLFPDWFAPPQVDWPPYVSLTGFPLFDESDLHTVDEELERFLAEGEPPVVFTPGSTLVDSMQFFSTASRVLARLGQRGIFLAKAGTPMPALPPTILVRSYVPLSALLPRSKMLVHHGGIGTVSQALAAGIPQLAVPFAHDQFDNAARVERLGCGLRLDAPVEEGPLHAALQRLLKEERFQINCASFKKRVIAGEAARMNALEVLERVYARSPRSGQLKQELRLTTA